MADNTNTIFTISVIAIVLAIETLVLVVMLDSRNSIYGAVTQGTSTTTAVTLNKKMGVITTFAQTAAAAGEVVFAVNNNQVKADSVVLMTIEYPDASTGFLTGHIGDIAAGSFKVLLRNSHAAAALNAAAKIHFRVL
jgi:hypothetical protein